MCFVRDGEPAGLDISFLRKFAAYHGIMKVDFAARCEFDGIWFMPGKERCDIAAAGISPWQRRKDESPGVVWTDDYFHVKRSLPRERDKDTFRTIKDFENKTIGVTRNSSADIDTEARKPDSAKTKYYRDQPAAVADLLAGSIDACAEGDVSNLYLAKDQPLMLIDEHEMDPKNPEAFSFPVRQASGIVDALNAWIEATKAEYLKVGI